MTMKPQPETQAAYGRSPSLLNSDRQRYLYLEYLQISLRDDFCARPHPRGIQ